MKFDVRGIYRSRIEIFSPNSVSGQSILSPIPRNG